VSHAKMRTSIYVDFKFVKETDHSYPGGFTMALQDKEIVEMLEGRELYRQDITTIGKHLSINFITRP